MHSAWGCERSRATYPISLPSVASDPAPRRSSSPSATIWRLSPPPRPMSRWVGLTPPAPSAHGWLPTTRSVLREALHPPLREASFWAVQVAVVTLAGLHFYLDSAGILESCLLYTSPSPRDRQKSRMPSSA